MSKVLGMSNGKGIDPYAYVPSRDFDRLCVAKSLSNICRYNGHYGWMSVAEHCLITARIMGERYNEVFASGSQAAWELLGLLHDSMESVFGDITSPVKHTGMFDRLRDLENHYLRQTFSLHKIYPTELMVQNLKAADAYSMSMEVVHLGYSDSDLWTAHMIMYPPYRYSKIKPTGLKNEEAEWLWLETYDQLVKEVKNEG